jgi:hypothetical protein
MSRIFNEVTGMKDNPRFKDTILLLTHDGMGHATVELQHKLLDSYLRLLLENGDLPAAVCFYTEGVKLIITGAPLLDRLRELETRGVRLVACSTCLNYYGLTESVGVGIVGSMADILEAQAEAGKVITL